MTTPFLIHPAIDNRFKQRKYTPIPYCAYSSSVFKTRNPTYLLWFSHSRESLLPPDISIPVSFPLIWPGIPKGYPTFRFDCDRIIAMSTGFGVERWRMSCLTGA
ncbi:hypothetical protein AVEN_36846-1 [Araneus ventricosus]|uniref:Uncharacterized protein n=1 Tax=Araneus ventricosus TaxID=182803 RepID=A0A4Y2V1L4_ARAVE|nr:hypothetical protein AVEN_36846-1 [Araneus ventricosus]